MNYQDAIALSDSVKGFVKCTFAEVYDRDGQKLYSVQKRHTYYKNASLLTDEHGGKRAVSFAPMVDVVPDMKLNYGKVAVRFTPEMREAIYAGMERNSKLRDTWKKMRQWNIDYAPLGIKRGDWQCIEELHTQPTEAEQLAWIQSGTKQYNCFWSYPEYDFVLNEQYTKLLEILQKNEVVYVRPVAIDWIPSVAVVTFLDGNKETAINIDADLAAAKKRLERAKTILAATTTLSFI